MTDPREPNAVSRAKTTVSVIHEGATTEIQWGRKEPVDGVIDGYALIHEDGTLTVPFRDPDDNAFVFVLNGELCAIYATEDQPPSDDADVVWARTLTPARPY